LKVTVASLDLQACLESLTQTHKTTGLCRWPALMMYLGPNFRVEPAPPQHCRNAGCNFCLILYYRPNRLLNVNLSEKRIERCGLTLPYDVF